MENLDLITQLQDFYEQAWDKLIIAGVLIFAILGLFVPLLYFVVQKILTRAQEAKIDQKINNMKNTLKDEIRTDIDSIKEELEKLIGAVTGMPFHMQANQERSENDFKGALIDYLEALRAYTIIVKGFTIENTQIVINNILNILPSLNKSEIEDAFLEIGSEKDVFMKALKKRKIANFIDKKVNALDIELRKI